MPATPVHQETVRRAIDAINRHDPEAWASLYTSDAVAFDPQYAEPLLGREAIKKDIADFFSAFPDLRAANVGKVLADGDTVAFEVEMSGSHEGPLLIPGGSLPPTHKRMELRGSRVIRVDAQGRITECRRYYDIAGILGQLGLMG